MLPTPKGSKKKRYSKEKSQPSSSKPIPTCNKCGKVGHTTNKIWTKRKLQGLQMDEGLKLQLSKLLINSSPDHSDEEINKADLFSSSNDIEEEGTYSNQCSKNQDY